MWQQWNGGREFQHILQPQHEVVAREVHADTRACLESHRERDRGGIQVADQLIEDRLQMRIGRIAGAVICTAMEKDIKGSDGCLWRTGEHIYLGRDDGIEDHTAQVRWIASHDGEGQPATVGTTLQVDPPIAKCADKCMHISRILQGRVGVQVDTRFHQTVVTHTQCLVIEAAQRGLRETCSALIEEDRVSVWREVACIVRRSLVC